MDIPWKRVDERAHELVSHSRFAFQQSGGKPEFYVDRVPGEDFPFVRTLLGVEVFLD